jgi:TolB-like protein/tetratricopeptide (TPR) repeat protein
MSVKSSGAVFLSYASEDALEAKRICESLRASEIEVWFDQNELRGGDAWDRRITHQIRECVLFIPIISKHTEVRLEGYFRREWRAAVERTRDMADGTAFLLPVVIDETSEAHARVPDRFREVQWTRLPEGQPTPQFVQHVVKLHCARDQVLPALAKEASQPGVVNSGGAARYGNTRLTRSRGLRPLIPALLAAILAAVIYFMIDPLHLRSPGRDHPPQPVASSAATVTLIDEKSIAILPFVDMSEKRDQEYFSDGLSEELIDHLTQNPDLKVIARTSSFQFKGKNEDMRSIANKLGVANLLEGSVRKTGQQLRITAQLIRASDGVHLWSQTYNRKLRDIFKIQDEIATTVTKSLNVALLSGARPNVVGTTSIEAYNLYLQAVSARRKADSKTDYATAENYTREALKADPNYAAAWAKLSGILSSEASQAYGSVASLNKESKQAAQRALELNPNIPETHLAMAEILTGEWNFALAGDHARQALKLDPNNSLALSWAGTLAAIQGNLKEAEELQRRAIRADPVNPFRYADLSGTLYLAEKFAEAVSVNRLGLDMLPRKRGSSNYLGFLMLMSGDPVAALAEMDRESDENFRKECYCRVMVYDALGRKEEAASMLANIEEHHAADEPYGIAGVYARRGDRESAFSWLERAYSFHDSNLINMATDPLFKNLEVDRRLNELRKKMNLPERTVAREGIN